MKILINADKNIDNRDEVTLALQAQVAEAFSRFAHQITRVEMHLRDESAGRSTEDDQRCMIEVRPAGQDPVVVTHSASTIDEAIGGALEKMQSLLASQLGRIHDRRTAPTKIDEHLVDV